MVRIRHVGEDAGVDMRIERLDPAIKAFREARDLRDFRHLHAQLLELGRGGTGGDHFCSGLNERLGEDFNAFLMVYGHQGPS